MGPIKLLQNSFFFLTRNLTFWNEAISISWVIFLFWKKNSKFHNYLRSASSLGGTQKRLEKEEKKILLEKSLVGKKSCGQAKEKNSSSPLHLSWGESRWSIQFHKPLISEAEEARNLRLHREKGRRKNLFFSLPSFSIVWGGDHLSHTQIVFINYKKGAIDNAGEVNEVKKSTRNYSAEKVPLATIRFSFLEVLLFWGKWKLIFFVAMPYVPQKSSSTSFEVIFLKVNIDFLYSV